MVNGIVNIEQTNTIFLNNTKNVSDSLVRIDKWITHRLDDKFWNLGDNAQTKAEKLYNDFLELSTFSANLHNKLLFRNHKIETLLTRALIPYSDVLSKYFNSFNGLIPPSVTILVNVPKPKLPDGGFFLEITDRINAIDSDIEPMVFEYNELIKNALKWKIADHKNNINNSYLKDMITKDTPLLRGITDAISLEHLKL